MPRRATAADVTPGIRDAWPKSRRPDLSESVHRTSRDSPESLEYEVARDRSGFVATLTVDGDSLATEIAFVIELCLNAGDVDGSIARVNLQLQLAARTELFEADVGMFQRARCRNTLAR